MKAYTGSTDPAVCAAFNSAKQDLGYGLLLKRYTDETSPRPGYQRFHPTRSTAVFFFPYHGGLLRNRIGQSRWLHRSMLYGIHATVDTIESGWFIAEYGRSPWGIGEILPTAITNSTLTAGDILFSMGLICGLYTMFLVTEMYLMFKFARLGPISLKTGNYHLE